MILLIDNYDSFSYNLYQLIGAVEPDIKVVRNDECTLEEIAEMKPEAIMEMDWLTDNVIGEIPTMGELRAEARPVVQIKGVEEKMK